MKIIHIHFGKDGGAERFFTSLARAFHERGVEQKFFIRPDRVWKDDIAPCGEVFEGTFNRLSLYRFVLAARLKRVAEEFQPDAIMAWAPRASQLLPRKAPCVKITRLGDFPLRLRYFGNADVIVGNTPDIVERVKELGWEKPARTISNFTLVKPTKPIDRVALATPSDAFVVVGLGRFVRRKGFHTLIDAVAKLPGVMLWLVGGGEEEGALKEQAEKLGLSERIRFAGWQASPAPYLAAADVFVMPSSHEPLGNVILEAWGARKPVVSSRSEGPNWMMTEGDDGLLFDVGDANGLAAAIAKIKSSPELAARLVEGGQKTLGSRFSADGVTAAYAQLISEFRRN